MNYSFSFFEIIILIGISEGFVVSALIGLYKRKSISKVLLSLILIVFNFLCIKTLLHTTGLWNYNYLRYFPLAFHLLIQPLFWLYTLSLVTGGFKLNKKHWLHFIPFIIFFTYALYIYVSTLGVQDAFSKDSIANSLHFNAVKRAEDYLSIASSIIYWLLGVQRVFRYRAWLYNYTSNTAYPTYAWLKNIAILMGVLVIFLTASVVLDSLFSYRVLQFIHWQVFFIYLAILIYYMGFKGYLIADNTFTFEQLVHQQSGSFTVTANDYPIAAKKDYIEQEDLQAAANPQNEELKALITEALEVKKMYLDPELSLQKLAKELNIGAASISAVINNSFNKSFKALINNYRVEAVKQKLHDPRSKKFSILGIAYECGFNSEASFYRIFKSVTGISTKAYFDEQQPAK